MTIQHDGANLTAIDGTPGWEEDWGLDPLGNWTDYDQKTAGTQTLNQSRTHNKANEVTGVTGGVQRGPVHDAAGNPTSLPLPIAMDNPDDTYCVYDAWNRLVMIDGEYLGTRGVYRYDGLNQRISKTATFYDEEGNQTGSEIRRKGWEKRCQEPFLFTRKDCTQSPIGRYLPNICDCPLFAGRLAT